MKSKLNSFQQSDLLYGTLVEEGARPGAGPAQKKYWDTPCKGWLVVTEASVNGEIIHGNFMCASKGPGYGGLTWPKFETEMVLRIEHGETSPFAALSKYYPALVNLKTRVPSQQCPVSHPETGEFCSMAKGHAGPHRSHGNDYLTWVTRCNGDCEYHSNQKGVGPPVQWEECIKCGHMLPHQLGRYVFETPSGAIWIYAPSDTDAVRNAKSFIMFTHVLASACQLSFNDRVIPLNEAPLETSPR